jgi:hypothetical protein
MTIAKSLPSQEELRLTFDYLPRSGLLVWLPRADKSSQWNGRFAGRISGTSHNGYTRVKMGGEFYQAHRLIWCLAYGKIPKGMVIDHINGLGDDNRLQNLRPCTNQQNQLNRRCDKGRDYKGVYRHKGKWKAEITTNGVRSYLGLHGTPEIAAIAYDAAARAAHGEHASLNFPNVFQSAA